MSTSLDSFLLQDSPDNLLRKTTKLGSGNYGSVFALEDTVIKVSPLLPNLLGCPYTSPFRSEHIEPRMLEFLWQRVLSLGNITPHIIAPKGSVPYGVMRESKSVAFLMERAKHDCVSSYLSCLPSNAEFNRQLKIILFQVCYTLEVLCQMFPGFRHNDLGEGNLLISSSPFIAYGKGRKIEYKIGNRTFYIPALPVIPLLADFDYACIPGMGLDNYKVLEMQVSEPHLRISSCRDDAADLCRLLYQLSHRFEETTYNTQSKRFWGRRGLVGTRNLSPGDLLFCSQVFDEFLAHEDDDKIDMVARYACPSDVPSLEGDMPDARRYPERRECCLFFPRPLRGAVEKQDTFTFLSTHMQPSPSVLAFDQERPTPYCKHEAARIEELFYAQFAIVRAMSLDPAQREGVAARVKDFLEGLGVPHRWWYFAYTCAFVDEMYTSTERKVQDEHEKEWLIEDWVERWKQVTGLGDFTSMQFLHFLLQWSLFFAKGGK